jgi:hypothetical protein
VRNKRMPRAVHASANRRSWVSEAVEETERGERAREHGQADVALKV